MYECYCCGEGQHGQNERPAVYEWRWSTGQSALLCARCCAEWRRFELEDTGLPVPYTVQSLAAARG